MSKSPWMKWYPADWRADPRLRMCSYAARGLWVDLLSLMHEAEPYGHLLINGITPTPKQLASILGGSEREVYKLLDELDEAGVFSVNDDGVIYSRRMVRDKAKADKDRENGGKGGNPKIMPGDNGGVNPPANPEDKATRGPARAFQILEARSQKDSDADASGGIPPPFDPVKDLWDRGIAILGEKHRSLLGKFVKTYGKVAVLAAIIECENEQPVDTAAYFIACLERGKANAGNGSAASAAAKLAAWARAEDEPESLRGYSEAAH